MDGDGERAGDGWISSRDGEGAGGAGGQLVVSGDQRESADDAGDACGCEGAGSVADDVWAERLSVAGAAFAGGAGAHQHGDEGVAGAAGPNAQGCVRKASGVGSG